MHFYNIIFEKNSNACQIHYWDKTVELMTMISAHYREIARIGTTEKVIIGNNLGKVDVVSKSAVPSLLVTTYNLDQTSGVVGLDNFDLQGKTIIAFVNNVIGFYDFTQTGNPWNSDVNLTPIYNGVAIENINGVKSLENSDYFAASIKENGNHRSCVYPIPVAIIGPVFIQFRLQTLLVLQKNLGALLLLLILISFRYPPSQSIFYPPLVLI